MDRIAQYMTDNVDRYTRNVFGFLVYFERYSKTHGSNNLILPPKVFLGSCHRYRVWNKIQKSQLSSAGCFPSFVAMGTPADPAFAVPLSFHNFMVPRKDGTHPLM